MPTESVVAAEAGGELDARIARSHDLAARADALFDVYQVGARGLLPVLRELRAIRGELDAAFAAASRAGRESELARHPDAVRRPVNGRPLQEEVVLPAPDGSGTIWPEPPSAMTPG